MCASRARSFGQGSGRWTEKGWALSAAQRRLDYSHDVQRAQAHSCAVGPPRGSAARPRSRGRRASGERRLSGGVPHRLRPARRRVGRALRGKGLDNRPLRRAGAPLHVLRLLVGPAMARLGNAPPLRPARTCQSGRSARLSLPALHRGVLRPVHLRRAAGQDHVLEPLLSRQPPQLSDDIHAAAPHGVARRPAEPAHRERERAGVGGLDAQSAAGRCVPLFRHRQTESGLALPCTAPAHMAVQQRRRPGHRRPPERALG